MPLLRGVRGLILLIVMENCIKYNIECLRNIFCCSRRGGGHTIHIPISVIIHCHNVFLFNNTAHLLVHSVQVSDIRPFQPYVLFVKNTLQLGEVNIMESLETSHHVLYDLYVLNSTYR